MGSVTIRIRNYLMKIQLSTKKGYRSIRVQEVGWISRPFKLSFEDGACYYSSYRIKIGTREILLERKRWKK